MKFGKFKRYDYCRFCKSRDLKPVLNLGNVPLAGGFLKNKTDLVNENFFPLELSFCKKCFLLQSINVVDADTLFKDYFYHSSAIGTLVAHFKKISRELKNTLKNKTNPFVVEIGANDGTLIKELTKLGINSLGIDPANNVVKGQIQKGVPILNDYFSERIAKQVIKKHGKADVITSFNTLAHIEDMNDIARGIKILLKDEGFLMFETHYLGKLIEETQYDMIYHEHQYYYSLITLINFFALHDMEIYDVKPIDIHHGSMRYYVQHKSGKRKISQRVKNLTKSERTAELDKVTTYNKLDSDIKKTKQDLLNLLKDLKSKGGTIAGYGASGRGTIIMNYCGLGEEFLNYVVDDAPAKQGSYTPGNHLKIKSSKVLSSIDRPDFVVVFAWAFIDEIKKRNRQFLDSGGKFILPLPRVRIV